MAAFATAPSGSLFNSALHLSSEGKIRPSIFFEFAIDVNSTSTLRDQNVGVKVAHLAWSDTASLIRCPQCCFYHYDPSMPRDSSEKIQMIFYRKCFCRRHDSGFHGWLRKRVDLPKLTTYEWIIFWPMSG